MKQPQHTTFNGAKTTLAQVIHWAQLLSRLHARIAARFARAEPRRRVLRYLQGRLELRRAQKWLALG